MVPTHLKTSFGVKIRDHLFFWSNQHLATPSTIVCLLISLDPFCFVESIYKSQKKRYPPPSGLLICSSFRIGKMVIYCCSWLLITIRNAPNPVDSCHFKVGGSGTAERWTNVTQRDFTSKVHFFTGKLTAGTLRKVCPKERMTPTFLFFSDGIGTFNPIPGRCLDS